MSERQLRMIPALNEALREEMRRDRHVFVMGEDVEIAIWGTTGGLLEEFGPARVRNTPISEAAIVGSALGAAAVGARPVVDLNISSFLYVAADQLVNQAGKLPYMVGGQIKLPVVYLSYSGAWGAHGAQHSDSPHAMFANAPGLKIVLVSTPRDAKGLLKTAIRDDSPVLFFVPMVLLGARGPVPEAEECIPFGKADIKRAGRDVTVVATGAMPRLALAAAASLEQEGISVEVVDPRTIVPLDRSTIVESVARTGRLIVVDESHRTCGFAAEVAAVVADEAFDALRAPIRRLTALDAPFAYNPRLEASALPSVEQIVAAARQLMERRRNG
ncbi:MAG: alpha-ketoacid dehydrogenase subunit beta [Chloroflexi bacterium]|nr:alpha-ketoacid dehydrogenase subunit beta [Chloroflexota bacterium]